MLIGVPKEIKTKEFRVGLTPSGVRTLVQTGHQVQIETKAGIGSGITDADFEAAGATIAPDKETIWSKSEMVVKVKEPIEPEYALMREGQLLFTYLHLAAAQTLGRELIERKVNSVAYETIETTDGRLPLLVPMSAVAGRMSVQAGATILEKEHGGKGILLGGVPGVRRSKVTIIGGGIVGANAAKIAVGFGAEVTVLDINTETLAWFDDIYQGKVSTLYSNAMNIEKCVRESDLVVGAVLVTGARAPQLVTEEMIKQMSPGSVIVDVAVDQGGCVATCRPTTHEDPTFLVHDVVHYCVANMPGAVPHTSTFALTNATMPYVRALADKGLDRAAAEDPSVLLGINTYKGTVPHAAVAEALGVTHTPILF